MDRVWRWYVDDIAPLEDAELDDKLGKPFMKVIRDHNRTCAPEDRLSERDMRANAAHVTFAGVLTTTMTLHALILQVLHHPEVKEKLRREIDEVVGNRTVSLNDRNNMPYTNAVINELQRLMPAAPIAVPRTNDEDAYIQGVRIPKGSLTVPNMYEVHYDKAIFGDPEAFRPERYLDAEGKLLPADDPVMRHSIPFGLGPRTCAGMLFAQYRIFLWTVTLYQRFDIVPDPAHPLPGATYDDCEIQGLSVMAKDYMARFLPRTT
jgi:cytochrome P450